METTTCSHSLRHFESGAALVCVSSSESSSPSFPSSPFRLQVCFPAFPSVFVTHKLLASSASMPPLSPEGGESSVSLTWLHAIIWDCKLQNGPQRETRSRTSLHMWGGITLTLRCVPFTTSQKVWSHPDHLFSHEWLLKTLTEKTAASNLRLEKIAHTFACLI